MVKIKICGLMDADCAGVLNEYRPDYAGFILSGGFRRSITASRAASVRERLRPEIQTVGVFVNDSVEKIAAFCRDGVIQLVQLHGNEDETYIAEVKAACSVPVLKAVGVNAGMVSPYPQNCDYVLLDTIAASGGGGTGRTVAWRRYDEIKKPVFLAGGITPDNVREGLRIVRPYGVDTSGGVETDGKKDAKKIIAYINNIRTMEEQ